MNEVNFLATNTNILFKLMVPFWECVAYHSQSTLNNKFPISLQYLKENAKDEINFLPVDKFFKFLGSFYVWPGMPKLPKIQVYYLFEIS